MFQDRRAILLGTTIEHPIVSGTHIIGNGKPSFKLKEEMT
jgi:hypothetical protein